MKSLKVSVITVCLNAADCIETAIRSVVSQTYPDIEYIIIDGGSADNTAQIIGAYRDKIARFSSEKDNGIYDAMNKGLKAASGDIIYFLNADDRLCDNDVIRDIAAEFGRDDRLAFLYGKMKYENIPEDEYEAARKYRTVRVKSDLLTRAIGHQSVFCRSWVFQKTGMFSLEYKILADHDWILSVFDTGVNLKYMDRHMAVYNCKGFSHKNRLAAQKEWLRIIYRRFPFYRFLFFIARYVIPAKINAQRKRIMRSLMQYG